MNTRAEQESQESSIAEAEIHDVLRNSRRRLVLERLAADDETQSVSALAEHIATKESGEDPPPRNVRQSVYVSLHQTHLPKLDDLEIVDYDADAKVVSQAANAADVAVYMEVVPEHAISWAEYYFGLSLFGLAALAGHSVGVPVLSAIDSTALAAALLSLITLSAGYQLLVQRDYAVGMRD